LFAGGGNAELLPPRAPRHDGRVADFSIAIHAFTDSFTPRPPPLLRFDLAFYFLSIFLFAFAFFAVALLLPHAA